VPLIEVPPLRERREDVSLLAAHFVKTSAQKMNTQAPQLTKGNIEQLQAYDWPGNVRELQNVVERAIIFAQTGALSFDFVRLRRATSRGSADLVAPTLRPAPTILTDSELKRRERDSILSALAQTNGKISGPRGAAELLGMKSRPSASSPNRSEPSSSFRLTPALATRQGPWSPTT
jgi:transcriptional regulator with GAF, ATPase, and Fis domain